MGKAKSAAQGSTVQEINPAVEKKVHKFLFYFLHLYHTCSPMLEVKTLCIRFLGSLLSRH